MINSKLHVKAVLRLPCWTPHDPRIVYQYIHPILLCNKGNTFIIKFSFSLIVKKIY